MDDLFEFARRWSPIECDKKSLKHSAKSNSGGFGLMSRPPAYFRYSPVHKGDTKEAFNLLVGSHSN